MDDNERFVGWLLREAISAARGDAFQTLPVRPDGRLWLGRLAPEEKVDILRRHLLENVP